MTTNNEWYQILAAIAVMAAVAVGMVWWTPDLALKASQYLLARSVALRAAREVYHKRFAEIWQAKRPIAVERPVEIDEAWDGAK